MPTRDRTGPDGLGPATGRGLGPCNRRGAGNGNGRGFRRPRYGRRLGMGFARRPMTTEPIYEEDDQSTELIQDEIDQIEAEEKRLVREKEYLKKQLGEQKPSE